MTRFSAVFRVLLLATLVACEPAWEPPSVVLDGASEQTQERVERAREDARSGEPSEVAALGDLYLALSYPEAAAECYGFAASRSGAAEHHLLAAIAAREANDLAATRKRLRALVEQEPGLKEGLLALAEIQLESGELEAAQRTYRQVLGDHPEDPRAMLGLARTHLAAEEGEPAINWFQRVLAARPGADRVRSGLAEAYRLAGRQDLARIELRRAGPGELMSDDPTLARVGRLRLEVVGETVLALASRQDTTAEEVAGFTVAQLGIVPRAHQGLAERASEIQAEPAPSHGRFWFAVGALAERQADAEAAVAAYQRALDALPDHSESQLRSGRALLKLGRLEEAASAFAASESEDLEVIRDRALVLRRLGRHDEAAQLLTEAIRKADDRSQVEPLRLDLAEILSGQGNVGAALEIYRAAVDSADSMVAATAWARIAAQQQQRGDDEAAAESFRSAAEAAPEWLSPRYGLAATLGRLGRYDEAAHEYRAILDLHPTEEQAWLGATTAAVFGQASPDAVRQFLERGLSVLPDSQQLQATLARHLVVTGGTDPEATARALELARSLVSSDPIPANRETLAMALAASGEYEQAAVLQQELLAVAEPADRPRLEMNLERYRARRPCCR